MSGLAEAQELEGSQGVSDAQAMVALDNKHNLAQREQYYAAVQKGISTHTVERVPGVDPFLELHKKIL